MMEIQPWLGIAGNFLTSEDRDVGPRLAATLHLSVVRAGAR